MSRRLRLYRRVHAAQSSHPHAVCLRPQSCQGPIRNEGAGHRRRRAATRPSLRIESRSLARPGVTPAGKPSTSRATANDRLCRRFWGRAGITRIIRPHPTCLSQHDAHRVADIGELQRVQAARHALVYKARRFLRAHQRANKSLGLPGAERRESPSIGWPTARCNEPARPPPLDSSGEPQLCKHIEEATLAVQLQGLRRELQRSRWIPWRRRRRPAIQAKIDELSAQRRRLRRQRPGGRL